MMHNRRFRLLEREDIIPGGKADDADASEFDPVQLKQGIRVEREHTKDDKVAKEITMDHLREDPRYYTKLKTIEPRHESVRGRIEPGLDGPTHSGGHPVGAPSYAMSNFRKRASGMRPPVPDDRGRVRAPATTSWAPATGRNSPVGDATRHEKRAANKALRRAGRQAASREGSEVVHDRQQQGDEHTPPSRSPLHLVGN